MVPRHSEFAPGHSLLSYNNQIPEPMPNNVSFTQNGGFIQSQLTAASPSHSHMSAGTSVGGMTQSPASPTGTVASPSSVGPNSPYGSIPGQSNQMIEICLL